MQEKDIKKKNQANRIISMLRDGSCTQSVICEIIDPGKSNKRCSFYAKSIMGAYKNKSLEQNLIYEYIDKINDK